MAVGTQHHTLTYNLFLDSIPATRGKIPKALVLLLGIKMVEVVHTRWEYTSTVFTAVTKVKHKSLFVILLTSHDPRVVSSLLPIFVVVVSNSFSSTSSTPRSVAPLTSLLR